MTNRSTKQNEKKTNSDYVNPMWSERCERGVVSLLLNHPEKVCEVASILSPKDFFSERAAVIYDAIRTAATNEKTDLENIVSVLRKNGVMSQIGGESALAEYMLEWNLPSCLVNYAMRIRKMSRERNVLDSLGAACKRLYQGDDLQNVIAELSETISESETDQVSKPVLLRDAVMATLIEEDVTGKAIPTGYSKIDNLITGFREGQMIIIAARPSMGKTSLAVNVMLNMAKCGKKVLFFSLEMSKAEIVQRMIAVTGECDLSKEVMAKSKPTHVHEKIAVAANEIFELPIHIDDTPGRTIFEIESIARNYVKKEGIEAIFVDHLGWVETGEKKQTEYEQVTQVARRMKNLARTLHVPVVVLSQLNRAVENRKEIRPRMSDLRSSGAIEQDADVIIFIHREEYYRKKEDAEADETLRGKADIIVAKVRNGATGDVRLNWEGCTTRFYEDPDVQEWNGGGF